jgi:RecA-family ATPase
MQAHNRVREMSNARTLISWEDFQQKKFTEPEWLINPYVPRNGIVFLWGETSSGKSPVGWHLAAAVGRGDNFCGLPAYPARVLYLEVDTPERLVHARISHMTAAPNVDFLFLPPLSVPEVSTEDAVLLSEAAGNNYDLVIVNTLRKVHNMDDKDSATPKMVYSFFQHTFPGSALLFVHHTKKTQVDQEMRLKENFSGAMNWLNDAQVGLCLQTYESEKEGINIRLHHEKSQVSARYMPLGLKLGSDGTEVRCPKYERLLATYTLVNESSLRGTALDAELSRVLECSPSHAYLLRGLVEDGHFPGVSWLGLKDKA